MEKDKNNFHKSVLTNEVLKYLEIKPSKTYLDVTFGGGGHTRAILESESTCKVIALDWDKKTIEKNEPKLMAEFGDRLEVIWANFSQIHRVFKKKKLEPVDGILADFGTSQFQIHNTPGISFQKDTPLDMRISQAHHYFKASDILNRFPEKEIAKILFTLGEEKNANKIAKAIVNFRNIKKLETTGELVEIIESVTHKYSRDKKKPRIHPATKTFQALRILVNKELENIEIFLKASLNFLNAGGNIVCISFHSLEDRIVKNFFKSNTDKLKILTPKPITASEPELVRNISSRSSKLRAAKKL